MSLSDRESGIVARHIPELEKACKDLNIFLFVRPTEYDSTKLIEQGYATKSMSVHDKSSNWGPMAGFVPCDQFFSKKYIGQPNPNPDYKDHGPAKVCHLRLTDLLVKKHDKMTLMEGAFSRDSRTYKGKTDNARAREIVFELKRAVDGWDVYWRGGGRTVPVYVWGYVTGSGKKPVTGDYDLWMVAPHMSWWKLHMQIVGVKDEHGSSCATLLNTWLLNQLNEACGRADNPVFNHGAEAQNYGFTQSLDRRIAMITPAGGSRMVDIGDMPKILADLQSAAYLVYWNKRYGEVDPKLSGQALSIDGIRGSELSKLIEQGSGIVQHLAKKNEKLSDILDVRKFYKQLNESMITMDRRRVAQFLAVGDKLDLPPDYREKEGGDTSFAAQKRLQQASVRLGGGGQDILELEKWVDKNISDIWQLCEAFGAAPGSGALGPESAFMLERIPGTMSYKRKDVNA
jgi:hypothetical protein